MENGGKKRIVVIGGGTGTHTLLSGLKQYAENVDIKAVVTMADSGGSTGRLRDEFGYLPVGDVRMALTALAKDTDESSNILRELFLYRFDRGEGLSGHTLGNLFLVALTDILGSEESAIRMASKVLATCGEVIPVTTDTVHLIAEYDNGEVVESEHEIDLGMNVGPASTITQLSCSRGAHANPYALQAISEADVVVLGPGDMYTSILANCIIGGVSEALCSSSAKIVYVSNLMSRSGQTNGMGTREYLSEINRYVGKYPEYMVVNTAPFRQDLLEVYHKEGEHEALHNYLEKETEVIPGDFVAQDDVILAKGDVLKRSLIRHDPHKLARAIMQLI
jgi:uncharacterized cofD-like protein